LEKLVPDLAKTRRRFWWILSGFALLLALLGPFLFSGKPDPKQVEKKNMEASVPRLRAPEFPTGMEWLNTDRPLSLAELRGKVVLLDFWTYCCINCMHVLPELKKLEKKYAKELAVVGVHSAKFFTEKETDNIRQAILRYEIEHPVLNDKDMDVWDEYAVRAWPTLYLIDPEGYIVGRVSGEGVYDFLDEKIGNLVRDFKARGLLKEGPLNLTLEKTKVPATLLSFPGKVLADESSGRLFIADSNHNRIVVASLAGEIQEVIGSGEIGLKDGSFLEARFHHPQGMAWDGENLYVADTENHALRRVDLAQKKVITLAGTGKQSGFPNPGGVGTQVSLNSPWDLIAHEGALYIAMAGSHQIWKMDLKTQKLEPFAGSGREARIDGPLKTAALAQPSGIATDGKTLYFADSEVSSIRSADLDSQGKVETIVGEDLFEFGDVDGVGPQVRLQHPLGIAYREGLLHVADTYNNKIKVIDPKSRRSTTLLNSKTLFDEPGGLSLAAGKIFVADTNHHAVRTVDLKTKEVATLEWQGMEKLTAQGPSEKFKGETISLPKQTVRAGAGKIRLNLQLPEGYQVNEQAPTYVHLRTEGKIIRLEGGGVFQKPVFPLEIPLEFKPGTEKLEAQWAIYYCEADKKSICLFKKAQTILPVTVTPEGSSSQVRLDFSIR
jgi:thiol-disulfide isomerase/thioredoxin